VRREPEPATLRDEVAGVVALVRRDGAPPFRRRESGEHLDRAVPLRVTGRRGEFRIDDQGVAFSINR